MICNSLHEKNKEQDYITMLKRNQVDGIIMASHLMNTRDYLDLNLPLVSLDRQLGPDIPFISSNNYLGGKLATEHLIEHGCRNLVHISGDMKIKKLSNERLTAFLDVCKAAKVTFHHLELPDRFVVDYNDEGVISNFFDIYPDCDGVFAGNDFIAMAVIGIVAKHKRKIPEELKIIGYDDDFFAPMLNPPLSTIRQPIEVIGRYAVEYLVRMSEGEEVPAQTILPVQLIKRQSTK
jgi:LacI family sucrose operon transcriptional repressor